MTPSGTGTGVALFVISKVDRVAFDGGLLTVTVEGLDGTYMTLVLGSHVAVDGVSRVQQALLGGKIVPWMAGKRVKGH